MVLITGCCIWELCQLCCLTWIMMYLILCGAWGIFFFLVMRTRCLYSNLKRRIVINLLIFLEITLLNLVLYKNHAASCFGSFGSNGVIVATLIIFRRDEIWNRKNLWYCAINQNIMKKSDFFFLRQIVQWNELSEASYM